MIRNIKTADLPAIRIEASRLAAQLYPEFIPDIDSMSQTLRTLAIDPRAFAKCVGGEGDPDAVLIAKSAPNGWATRRHATVMLWYSRRAPWGSALLREFRKWAMADSSLVVAGFLVDAEIDGRVLDIVRRVGFARRGGAYVVFPRGAKA